MTTPTSRSLQAPGRETAAHRSRQQLLHLLHTPLAELSPPGLPPDQLAGLRSLPESNRLKLIYAVKALEPLAERPPDAALGTLRLTAEILAALGRYAARNPGVSLTALRIAAALTVIDLRTLHGSPLANEAEIFLTPEVLHLEAAALMPVWRARSAGKSGEVLRCAAGMVLELWEFADQLRRSPETSPGALIHANGWASPATAKILRELALGCAVGELVPHGHGRGGGMMRAFRPPAAPIGRRRSARRAAPGGRGE